MRFPEFEDEWVEKKLGDSCKMQAGKFVSASEINDLSKEGLFPCYGGNGLRGYTESFTQDGRYSLIGRQGALCGNVTLVDGKFHATEHAIVVTPNKGMDTTWMFYLLTRLNLNQHATGMAQPGLSVQNLEKVETIISNTIEEQQKMASFLSLIDERIRTQRKIIDYLETAFKALRDQIFTQKLRFKNAYGSVFSDWQAKRLGDICQKSSSNISANTIEENFGDYIIYGASGPLKRIDFYNEASEYISIVKDGAGVGRLFFCEGKSSVLSTMDIIKPKTGVNTYFLLHLLLGIDFKKYTTGSTIPHIYFRDYQHESCTIPSIDEQSLIAQFLYEFDKKIQVEKDLISLYQSQKKSLLSGLFI